MENRISHYRSYLVATGNGPGENTFPKAFVNILLFDKDFNFLDIAYEPIDGGEQPVGSSTKTDHDHLTREYTVREEGYAYVYISNENPTYMQVYFDDVTITHTPSRIIQYNEYYPYGLRTGASWTRENNSNNFLYNAGSELNETIGWYETMLRDYDPVLGRFMQVDPLATRYASLSGYHYAFGNPVMFNDPSGAYGEQSGSIPSWLSDIIGELMQSRYGGRWDGNGYSYYTSAQQAYQSGVAYNDYHNSWGYTYYGSRRASAQAYRNMKRTGSRHLPSRSHFAHGKFRWKKDNGSNISFSFQDALQGPPGDTDNWWSNLGTAIRLTAGWAIWFGDDETFNNDRVAKALINSRIVGEGRDYWYQKVNSGNPITTSVTNFAGVTRLGGGNFGLTGLWNAGIDPIEQFIGSTSNFSITSDGRNLTYTITNTTSFKSLMYGLTPEWLNFYNTHQTYIFSEPIDFKRINK